MIRLTALVAAFATSTLPLPGVKAELHIYSNAGHGFGYRPDTTTAAGAWPFRFREWLVDSGLLK